MAEKLAVLKAEKREKTGKRANQALRNDKKLPAVVYGPDFENMNVSVVYRDFEVFYRKVGKHEVFNLDINGKKAEVIVKDYEIHPVSRLYLGIDFYVVPEKGEFTTSVPVVYTGVPVGVKEGGSLFEFVRSLKVVTEKKTFPSVIEVDISSLKVGQNLIVRDIVKDGYRVLTHEGTTLVEVK